MPGPPRRSSWVWTMNDIASGLYDLHQILTEMNRVRTELDRGPRQVRAKQRLLENRQADIEDLQKRLLQARKTADEKELQLKSHDDKLASLQVKLNQATSNQEFEAIKRQMEADQMANSVLEDEIFEVLNRVDTIQGKIAAGQAEKAELEQTCETFAKQVSEKEGTLRSELSLLEASLSVAEKIIPASLQADYRRLVQAHGPNSLAAVDEKACSSCRTTMTAQQMIDLRMGKFIFCRSCGRLLYQVEQD